MCNLEISSLRSSPSSYVLLSSSDLSKLQDHLVNETFSSAKLSFRDKYLLIYTSIKALTLIVGDIKRYRPKGILDYPLNRENYSMLYLDISIYFTQANHHYVLYVLKCYGIKCALFFDLVQFLAFSCY